MEAGVRGHRRAPRQHGAACAGRSGGRSRETSRRVAVGAGMNVQAVQWIIAAATATFVAVVAFLQWRTAQHKAVLDLFERRLAIYKVVREAVGTMASNSNDFNQQREGEFLENIER